MSTSRKVGIGDMVGAIEDILTGYADDIYDGIKADAEEVAKSAVKELKANSPVGEGEKGHYKTGWGYTTEHSPYIVGVTVHNKKKPTLTHLLEGGHNWKFKGVVRGRRKAVPHIATAEQKVVEEFEKRVRERLSK